ncbi:MAG: malto-oligosyltrehalose trehalohydrolase, partial [Acidobacteria bacterium]|nr:malto-oligosyltrehalose trehalohydrolase [Acidobacteriota bacterium]
DPSGLEPPQFVFCIQNHDQIGNRAFGDRLHGTTGPATFRATSALLLSCPETPLLFMGQEWAASSPFLYFTDHREELGRLVSEGRRAEFRHFQPFTDSLRRAIPDPQALETFLASKLRWDERDDEPHASMRRFYQALLALRREAMPRLDRRALWTGAPDRDTVVVALRSKIERPSSVLLTIARLRGRGRVDLGAVLGSIENRYGIVPDRSHPLPEVDLSTEDPRYANDPAPVHIESSPSAAAVDFARPGAVIFRIEDRA